jgi:ferredoxin
MPEVIFAPRDGHRLVIDAPRGGSLADLCDVAHAPVAFSCRSATCGTCRVAVLEGESLLLPAEPDERELLATLPLSAFAAASHRLACTTTLQAGPGRVMLCPLDTAPATEARVALGEAPRG